MTRERLSESFNVVQFIPLESEGPPTCFLLYAMRLYAMSSL